MIFQAVLAFLASLSFALAIWQWVMARRFPLHKRVKTPYAPALTILKPLKGCDHETRQCLQSWFDQHYTGKVQILFGVASQEDPVCDVVRQLMDQFPATDATLVHCTESFGPNAKVTTLIQLAQQAKNEVIIVSDADVRVPQDFLSQVVQPLSNPEIGLINCFYRFANPTAPAMQWEAIAVNADFWSQVLQSVSLKPMDFALGAVMATRREQLRSIGGFESLVEYLADDYQLGNRIARTGKKIVLSSVVVECWESPKNWGQVWNHQLRWARTIRICQPMPFFLSIISNATLWPLAWLILGSLTTCAAIIPMTATFFILARIGIALNLQQRLEQTKRSYLYGWMVPIKDLMNALVWAMAFLGNEVVWRGTQYRVERGGKLMKQPHVR